MAREFDFKMLMHHSVENTRWSNGFCRVTEDGEFKTSYPACRNEETKQEYLFLPSVDEKSGEVSWLPCTAKDFRAVTDNVEIPESVREIAVTIGQNLIDGTKIQTEKLKEHSSAKTMNLSATLPISQGDMEDFQYGDVDEAAARLAKEVLEAETVSQQARGHFKAADAALDASRHYADKIANPPSFRAKVNAAREEEQNEEKARTR